MQVKPILFSGPDVRAVFDGWKTQMRRVVEPQPDEDGLCRWAPDAPGVPFSYEHNVWRDTSDSVYRPRYVPGDILWVRETHGFFCPGDPKTGLPDRSDIRIIYPATDEVPDIGVDEDDWFIDERPLPMRPSIHMPKWACRLWLRVTDTDVEQIQDMTEQGAEAEGFTSIAEHSPGRPDKMIRTARQSFRDHWETRYPGSWERNDWVWVYEFERCERPAGWPESEVAA